ERFRLNRPARGLEHLRQVVEVTGEVRMIGTEAPLVDGQGAAKERLGLAQPVRGPEHLRQVLEASGDLGTVRAEAPFPNRQGAAAERFRLNPTACLLEQRG